jgi:hypothetical protein
MYNYQIALNEYSTVYLIALVTNIKSTKRDKGPGCSLRSHLYSPTPHVLHELLPAVQGEVLVEILDLPFILDPHYVCDLFTSLAPNVLLDLLLEIPGAVEVLVVLLDPVYTL